MKRFFLLTFFPLIFFLQPLFPFDFSYTFSSSLDSALDLYLSSLTQAQRLSLLFLVNIEGSETYYSVESYKNADGSTELLVPGGCLFFSYNLAEDAGKIIAFTNSIEKFCKDNTIPCPYLALDQEGGYVNRLSGITSNLPSSQTVASRLSPAAAYQLYKYQAQQLHSLGFTMNLAPVAEVSAEWNQDMLQTRSFGNLSQTQAYSIVAISAYQSCGVGSAIKHFPGNTNIDPHTGLPEIDLSKDALDIFALAPFSLILQSKPAAVLMSHARTSIFDSKSPACLSSFWVGDTLLQSMGFQGLVLSDDIFMAALEDNGFPPQKAALQALEAGVDVIMLSEKKFGKVAKFLADYAESNPSFATILKRAQKKVLFFKIQTGQLLLKKGEDGSYSVVEQSLQDRLGNPSERLEKFNIAKKEGRDFYNKTFTLSANSSKDF